MTTTTTTTTTTTSSFFLSSFTSSGKRWNGDDARTTTTTMGRQRRQRRSFWTTTTTSSSAARWARRRRGRRRPVRLRRRQRRLGGVRGIVRRANRANGENADAIHRDGGRFGTDLDATKRKTGKLERGNDDDDGEKRTSNRVHPRGRVVRVHVPASLGFAARER